MNILEELKPFFKGDKLSSGVITYIRNRPHLKEFFVKNYPDKKISEALYLLKNNINITPKCIICGKDAVFKSYGEGYSSYCTSKACLYKGRQLKAEKTLLKKYGVKHPAQNKEILNKMKKTTKERYGVDSIFKDRKKMKEGMKKKYGVETPGELYLPSHLWTKEVKQKMKETNLKKYGVTCSLHNPQIQKKVKETKSKKYYENIIQGKFKEIVDPLFKIEEYKNTIDELHNTILYPWICKKCGKEFKDHMANGHIPRCPYCYPSIKGKIEEELYEWLIKEFPNEKIIANTRKIISPLELDIYFPERKLAIELNELYYHSEAGPSNRGRNYHLNKTKKAGEKGIQLIHIWDIEWADKQEIVKSMIRSKLGKYERKINARECNIKNISSEESNSFLNDNHIQGEVRGSIRLGLFTKENELVSLMVLGKNRFKNNTYEIVRFVSKVNTSVRGAFSKLLKYANIKGTIRSYVDLRWFNGKVNESGGFKYLKTNPPTYYYTKEYKILLNRMTFQKKKIQELFPNKYDESLTEWENMQLLGYDRVWDVGIKVYEKQIKNPS